MWHTHVLFSISKYNDDCLNMIGCELNHDDSIHEKKKEEYWTLVSRQQSNFGKEVQRKLFSFWGLYPEDPFFQPAAFNYTGISNISEEYSKGSMRGFTIIDPHDKSYIYGDS